MASKDKFTNMACITLQESAPNTLTFAKLETGIALFEKVAWLISRIEFVLQNIGAALLNGDGDDVTWALTVSNQLSTLSTGDLITNPAIIYGQRVKRMDIGTPATGMYWVDPAAVDFSTLPGGGLLVPPNPLWGAIEGYGCASAALMYLRIYYTNYQLSGADEYWELVESRRIIAG